MIVGPPPKPPKVETEGEIRQNVVTFADGAKTHSALVNSLLRQGTYWVYDPETDYFAIGKFCGFKGMTVLQYQEVRSKTIQGGEAQLAIAKVLGRDWESSEKLADRFVDYAEHRFGPGALDEIKRAKWQFITLGSFASAATNCGAPQQSEVAVRRAVEQQAVHVASRFLQDRGFSVDESPQATKPYDLLCKRQEDVLHVEVKGLQGTAQSVLLTRNEVDFARTNQSSMALLVIYGINVEQQGAKPIATGGEVLMYGPPWVPGDDSLSARQYDYTLPDQSTAAQK